MKKLIILLAVLLAAVAHGFELPRARSAEPEQLSDATLECREKPVELGIVLDSSKSIWLFDFLHAIKFLQDLVSYFDIGPTKTRVALISFGDGVHIDTSFDLNNYTTKAELLEAISKTPHTFDQHTSTALGIDYMRDVQLSAGKVRPDANKIAVVITDGNSQNKKATADSAAKAEAEGIKIIAVGVGNKVNEKELENIAAGHPDRVIRTRKYSQLKTILEPLREKICEPVIIIAKTTPKPMADEMPVMLLSPTEPPKDEAQDFHKEPLALQDEKVCEHVHIELGIILDSSSSIWRPDFERAKKFLQKLIDALDIGPDETRVSFILYGFGIYTDQAFNLTTYKSGKEIKAAIGDVEHQIGLYTSTWEAIDFMRDHQLDVTHVRPGLKKVAVVVTDGNSQEGKKTAAAASKAVEQDINMIAVGVGKWVNDQELENIAGGNSNMVIRADNFPRLMEVLGTLRTKICQPNE